MIKKITTIAKTKSRTVAQNEAHPIWLGVSLVVNVTVWGR